MPDEKYTFIFGVTALAGVAAIALLFITASVLGISGLAIPTAISLAEFSFWAMLWAIPGMLFLFFLGEIADERAASNDHRTVMVWQRHNRTITHFLVPAFAS